MVMEAATVMVIAVTMAGEQIDAIIPIPDTSRASAMALAEEIGVRYAECFIKNRYIGRTFILPGQTTRKKLVRQKLNPIDIEFKGKNVLLATVAEYMEYATKIDSMAPEIYRYLNFDKMPEYVESADKAQEIIVKLAI